MPAQLREQVLEAQRLCKLTREQRIQRTTRLRALIKKRTDIPSQSVEKVLEVAEVNALLFPRRSLERIVEMSVVPCSAVRVGTT